MTKRTRYVIEGADHEAAAAVCAVVFDVLGPTAVTLRVDAYSDFAAQMPAEVRAAEERLRRRGFARAEGDPARSIVIGRSDETGWDIARAYTPWSIRTSLFDADDVNIATLDDGGSSVVVDVTSEQAVLLGLALGDLGTLVALDDPAVRRP